MEEEEKKQLWRLLLFVKDAWKAQHSITSTNSFLKAVFFGSSCSHEIDADWQLVFYTALKK